MRIKGFLTETQQQPTSSDPGAAKSDQQSRTWGVGLGQLLLSMTKQDTETFYEKLKLEDTNTSLGAAHADGEDYNVGW
ncbi:hypothetical protein OJAV_G00236790 [Oryzias javanicus]|uniref:Uncharacterized protein n=1 Tax=Oryzias javanicus TaxID=123683 RepID=A0A437BYB4_ORYJA|nr:hypothetical protein OJAV_G00236790 [Oryzias javanicus]